MRATARRFGTSLLTVQRWAERAGEQALDAVDWSDLSRAPRRTRHTSAEIEDEIVRLRSALKEGILGECGPAAIRDALLGDAAFAARTPSVRTIARILERRGALDGQRRTRRPPPPRGWYLPDLAARRVELDSFDVIDDHHLAGSGVFQVLTGVSLHGGLPIAWPTPPLNGRSIVEHLLEHWADVGMPGYAQFDNDTRFHGSHAYPDLLGPVVRTCLALSVVPVFAPPREHGFQAAIEHFNGVWQTRVLGRQLYRSLDELVLSSDAYVRALRGRLASRIEAAPARRALPAVLSDLAAPLAGRMVFVRRTNDAGQAIVLGRPYQVDTAWLHRLVRAELDFGARTLSFYALRRREPADQPLLAAHPYQPITKHTYAPRRR